MPRYVERRIVVFLHMSQDCHCRGHELYRIYNENDGRTAGVQRTLQPIMNSSVLP